MAENYYWLKIIFALVGSIFLANYIISMIASYKYVQKNLSSICNLFFGDPNYYKKLDWSNHFLIEMTVGMIAALRFRELSILKREKVFSKGRLSFAPKINDHTMVDLFKEHGVWYKTVVKTIIFSVVCLLILVSISVFIKTKLT